MKKDYVNLKVQVVEVQLSDCIAGSNIVTVNQGTSQIIENDNSTAPEGNTQAMKFSVW